MAERPNKVAAPCSHVAQERQRLCCQDAGVHVGGAGAHQEALGHLPARKRGQALGISGSCG